MISNLDSASIVAIVVNLMVGAISFGYLKGKVDQIKEDLGSKDTSIKEINHQMRIMHENFTSSTVFQETMRRIDHELREIRGDTKKIFECFSRK